MRPFLTLALLAAASAPALAQEAGRFQMEKTEQGFVRLDTETGAVASCREEASGLVCRMAADERSAMEEEAERLRAELEALEGRVAALEKAKTALPLPTETDIDKTLGLFERLFRGFVGIARDLERETEGRSAPDRT